MHGKQINKWVVVNGEWFENDFSNFIMSDQGKVIRSYLGDRKYKVSDTGETYRVISSWSEAGLLLNQEGRENGWRKFSLSDMLWLQIIKELRALGLGLDKLRGLKSSILENYNGLLLDFFIAQVISNRDIVLIIHPSGFGALIRESEYSIFQSINPSPASHIIISLNKLYADLINKPELKNKNEDTPVPLDTRQVKILNRIIEDSELKEIVIKPNKGKIGRVEFKTQKHNPEEAINEIRLALKDGKRKEITLKQEDGKVVLIERVDKT